jgi:hypothetical protein
MPHLLILETCAKREFQLSAAQVTLWTNQSVTALSNFLNLHYRKLWRKQHVNYQLQVDGDDSKQPFVTM